MIDWTNPLIKISQYFTVKEATYLPSWQLYHIPSEEEAAAILSLAAKMDKVREFIGKPINVECWIRPKSVNVEGGFDPTKIQVKSLSYKQQEALSRGDYNAFIGGAKNSAHIYGKAIDWWVRGMSADQVRTRLKPKLKEFELCMEDLPGSGWIHNDIYPPRGGKRFFKP